VGTGWLVKGVLRDIQKSTKGEFGSYRQPFSSIGWTTAIALWGFLPDKSRLCGQLVERRLLLEQSLLLLEE
jgi:hypothetical protein